MGALGYLTPCSYKDLGIGDLLDIKLWVDITLTRGPDTVPRISFNLAFDEIVVVQTAGEVRKVCELNDPHFDPFIHDEIYAVPRYAETIGQ